MHVIPTPIELVHAAENVTQRVLYGPLADVRPQPSSVLHQGLHSTVLRYKQGAGAGPPVLLVPPLAAPAFVFDLRRGCSLVEHLRNENRAVYLLDYGAIAFRDRHMGLEHWVREVIPDAVKAVSKDSGGQKVHLVGWCLGGLFAALTAADDPKLPIASLTLVASPFDSRQVPMLAPLRPLVNAAGGGIGTVLYRAVGTAPGPVVKRIFQLATFDRYVTKPLAILGGLDNRDFLEQVGAVDRMMNNMHGYPGRAFGQIYHDVLRTNTLADGKLKLAGRGIDVRKLKLPLLSIAGEGDGIAPRAAVHRIGDLVPHAQLETAPGGHVGVLTGRDARTTTWPMIDRFLDELG